MDEFDLVTLVLKILTNCNQIFSIEIPNSDRCKKSVVLILSVSVSSVSKGCLPMGLGEFTARHLISHLIVNTQTIKPKHKGNLL